MLTGPIFALLGAIIFIIALRARFPMAMLYGASAVAFAILIVLLINIFGWSPKDAEEPVPMMSGLYCLLMLPVAVWVMLDPKGRPEVYPEEPAVVS